MTDSRAKELVKQGDYLFTKKETLLSLYQEQADNFYPERADFTVARNLGDDFAGNLTTSFPVLARRELGSAISSMLRPADQDWFKMSVAREDRIDEAGRAWLEQKSMVMRRAMYDRASLFVRATKEADNDFVTFGNAVMSTELNRNRNGLLYRTWHLRDVAWMESNEGKVDVVHRRWKPSARELAQTFGEDKLHSKVKECLNNSNKSPYSQFNCRHVVMPASMYDTYSGENKFSTPFVSVYVDVDNCHVIEETGVHYIIYSIPRWQTVSGSQYGYSPATVAALPDARLIQAMTLTLLEAGEKAVNPPMIAQNDVVRSDISIFAGGVTWVDGEYDERMGDSIRPMNQDYSSLPFGFDMREDIKASIMEAFYLNKLNLPPANTGDMTATEVSQRVQEYIRNALPLFEPMESEYNGSLCEHTFEIMLREGAFGSAFDMPESLRGQEVQFKFESPLNDATDREKGHTFMEAKQMLAEAAQLDPASVHVVDARAALRDALKGVGAPATWLRDDQDVEQRMAAQQQRQQQAEMMATMEQGGKAAAAVGKAASEMNKAQ